MRKKESSALQLFSPWSEIISLHDHRVTERSIYCPPKHRGARFENGNNSKDQKINGAGLGYSSDVQLATLSGADRGFPMILIIADSDIQWRLVSLVSDGHGASAAISAWRLARPVSS